MQTNQCVMKYSTKHEQIELLCVGVHFKNKKLKEHL